MVLDKLLSPIKIGKIEIPNRVALAPMGVSVHAPDDSWPKRTIRYFEERAIGGTGLIITSFTRVHNKIATGPAPLVGIYEDRLISSHAQLVERIHRHDSKIFIQISLFGAKFGGLQGPSEIYSLNYNKKPVELTTDEVETIIEYFINGAVRASQAGYDGVEIHGGYDYLIGAMVSPALNKRTDKYGGSFENRMRFPLEIYKGIRQNCPDMAVGYKFSAYEWLPGGIDVELGKKIGRYMADAGVDFLDVASASSTTVLVNSEYPAVPPVYVPRNTLMPLSKAVKEVCPEVPVLANGAITVPQEADEAIAAGLCDMVAMGRGLIADPHWVNNARAGRPVVQCIRCNVCHHQLWRFGPLWCSMNPYVLKEASQDLSIPSRKKKVMVVGAGPAGLRCAITASKRGHDVTVYEKKPFIGGMMYPGSRPKFKEDVALALDWFKYELDSNNVKLELNTNVTPELVEKISPDALVIATGSNPIMPDVPGIEMKHVDSAVNILSDISQYKGEKAVVIGGGDVGCETACFLADNGFKATIVEMLPKILEENEITEVKLRLMNLIKERNIEVITESHLNAIYEGGVELMVPYDTQMGVKDGGREMGIDADLVAIAINAKPDEEFISALSMKAEEFYIIGDCSQPGRIREAVEAGENIARVI
ncbi:MAG TPA: hypothetical protein DCS12_10640 [Clostridiales bacterium]|nr:hypothetical protein [Clostridiales bacterium]